MKQAICWRFWLAICSRWSKLGGCVSLSCVGSVEGGVGAEQYRRSLLHLVVRIYLSWSQEECFLTDYHGQL